MEFWYCVMTFSLLVLVCEVSSVYLEPNLRNLQSSSNTNDNLDPIIHIAFKAHEYDPEKLITRNGGPVTPDTKTSIYSNESRFNRVVQMNYKADAKAINHVFGNVFESILDEKTAREVLENILEGDDIENAYINISGYEKTTCYFGEVFPKNEQYYEFAIKPIGGFLISFGFGYAWNNHQLKGRTAEFLGSERGYTKEFRVLLSKNDNDGNIVVEIQRDNVIEVLTSPSNRLYRPVVCLKGSAEINVTVYNGMKMASIPNWDSVVLPNASKKLKPLTNEQSGGKWSSSGTVSSTNDLLGLGLIETHTLTFVEPNIQIFTGYFFDGLDFSMSPSLVDKKDNWGNGDIYTEIAGTSTSISLSVWIEGREGHSLKVLTSDRDWESKIFAIYDTSRSSSQREPRLTVSSQPGWVTEITKHHCSGVETCSEGNECYWPRSDRQNLLPGLCITITCKYVIEAHVRTGLYKPDGDRTIGGEIAMRLIAPSDVGVKRKGIAMIKALLDRAEDFGDIEPTGDYEFGGRINPPNSANGSQQRYFNDVDLYLDVDKSVCEEKQKFIPIKSIAGIIVGFGKYINFFDYIRCVSHYAVIENLVTNALDPKKWSALELYGENQYQRLDPNRALNKYESENSNIINPGDQYSPDAADHLPEDVTRKLYYIDPDAFGGYSDKPQFSSFYNRDYYSAETVLYLGLTSCFGDCVKHYYANNYPVFHVTTFVRERTNQNSVEKKYYTEVHPLMWHYGLYYYDIDFDVRDVKMTKNKRDVAMTLFDEHNIPSWFVNKNGNDIEVVEASYISLPDLHKKGDHPSNPYLTVDNFAYKVVESS